MQERRLRLDISFADRGRRLFSRGATLSMRQTLRLPLFRCPPLCLPQAVRLQRFQTKGCCWVEVLTSEEEGVRVVTILVFYTSYLLYPDLNMKPKNVKT